MGRHNLDGDRLAKRLKRMRWLLPLIFPSLLAPGRNLCGPAPELRLLQNGEFHAEHGLFFVEAGRLHVYSALPTIFNDKTKRWDPVPNDDAMKSRWQGEAFYYERFQLRLGKWVLEQRTFSRGPSAYLDFGPCDPSNQLDLPSAEFKKVLPAAGKIKSVTEYADYATVVSSRAPRQLYPRYSLDAYSLEVSLLTRAGSAWELHETLDIGADGFFCGTRILSTNLADGNHATILLLYTDEPAASSNYRAIHSFIVTSSATLQTSRDTGTVRGDAPQSYTDSPNTVNTEGTESSGSTLPVGTDALLLPEKLVQAVADSESRGNPSAIHVIARIENGVVLLDAFGKPVPDTLNYGLMQINTVNIGKTVLKDAQGRPFTVAEDVKTDWKANARAGVALLAQQYQLAGQEQGSAGTAETYAQQTYSGYTGGTRNRRRFAETK